MHTHTHTHTYTHHNTQVCTHTRIHTYTHLTIRRGAGEEVDEFENVFLSSIIQGFDPLCGVFLAACELEPHKLVLEKRKKEKNKSKKKRRIYISIDRYISVFVHGCVSFLNRKAKKKSIVPVVSLVCGYGIWKRKCGVYFVTHDKRHDSC